MSFLFWDEKLSIRVNTFGEDDNALRLTQSSAIAACMMVQSQTQKINFVAW